MNQIIDELGLILSTTEPSGPKYKIVFNLFQRKSQKERDTKEGKKDDNSSGEVTNKKAQLPNLNNKKSSTKKNCEASQLAQVE